MSRTPLTATEIYRNLMKHRDIDTKRALADHFGADPTEISTWETKRGNRVPARRLQALADKYGYNLNWLRYGEGPIYSRTALRAVTGDDTPTYTAEERAILEAVLTNPRIRRLVEAAGHLPPQKLAAFEAMADGLAIAAARHKPSQK